MELIPIFSNVKSFYGKATILGWYSQTTTSCIKEFLMQYGFEIGTKEQLIKLYCK